MYINPILVGVIATIGFEIAVVIVYTAIGFLKYKNEQERNGEE